MSTPFQATRRFIRMNHISPFGLSWLVDFFRPAALASALPSICEAKVPTRWSIGPTQRFATPNPLVETAFPSMNPRKPMLSPRPHTDRWQGLRRND